MSYVLIIMLLKANAAVVESIPFPNFRLCDAARVEVLLMHDHMDKTQGWSVGNAGRVSAKCVQVSE